MEGGSSQAMVRTVKISRSSNSTLMGGWAAVEQSQELVVTREDFGASMAGMAKRSKYITASEASTC